MDHSIGVSSEVLRCTINAITQHQVCVELSEEIWANLGMCTPTEVYEYIISCEVLSTRSNTVSSPLRD